MGQLCIVKGLSGIDQQFIHYLHPLAILVLLSFNEFYYKILLQIVHVCESSSDTCNLFTIIYFNSINLPPSYL